MVWDNNFCIHDNGYIMKFLVAETLSLCFFFVFYCIVESLTS
jgi:hypothetical protein